MVRGLSFTPEDDAALARSWVNVSSRHDEQNSHTFWEGVRKVFLEMDGLSSIDRTADSLRCRWNTLQRLVQKYFSAEKAYNARPVSGETAQDALSNIMRLYCSRSKKKDSNGILRDSQPRRSMLAVDILRNCPKFNGVMAKNSELEFTKPLTVSGEKNTATNLHNNRKEILTASPSKHIIKGTKFTKNNSRRVNSYDGLELLAATMRSKTAVKERELRLRCISELPDTEMKTKLLLYFLESIATQEQDKSDAKAESVQSTHSDGNQTRMSIVDLISNE